MCNTSKVYTIHGKSTTDTKRKSNEKECYWSPSHIKSKKSSLTCLGMFLNSSQGAFMVRLGCQQTPFEVSMGPLTSLLQDNLLYRYCDSFILSFLVLLQGFTPGFRHATCMALFLMNTLTEFFDTGRVGWQVWASWIREGGTDDTWFFQKRKQEEPSERNTMCLSNCTSQVEIISNCHNLDIELRKEEIYRAVCHTQKEEQSRGKIAHLVSSCCATSRLLSPPSCDVELITLSHLEGCLTS